MWAALALEPDAPISEKLQCLRELQVARTALVKQRTRLRNRGQWKGKSFISGGRKPLRDALYMPALVAMRFNPDLKAKYTALR